MTNPLIDLTVAAKFAMRALATRLRGDFEPAPDLVAFETAMNEAIAALPPGIVSAHQWLTLPATEPPWRDTGIDLEPDSAITYFAAGRVYASRALDVWVSPKNQIWTRIGEKGEIFSSSRDSHTLVGDEQTSAGGQRLYFGNCFPNDWRETTGVTLQDDKVYNTVSGETRIVVITWAVPERDGLAALLVEADPLALVSNEIERLDRSRCPPDGWRYLWNLGDSEVFSGQSSEGAPSIHCDVHGDVAILQKDVDVALGPDCEISWDWTVEVLPGLLREDTVPSHDYLSIAVEFDNGWDITYYWSKELPEETGYICPLPNWKHREYHVVVRTGEEGLGQLISERRNVARDYEEHMRDLGVAPKRIVRVWLIANSVFMRQHGLCNFSNIRLHSEGEEVVVL